MAPGRRRGGGRLKGTSDLSLGDLVLAKVKGFPAWPAKISRPEKWGKTADPRKYFVYFFGTSEIAFVAPADIQAFTVEVKNKLVGRCKGKPLKFTQAVREICEEFEELQQKKLNGSEDDTSRDGHGSENCSMDADGDNAMEVDMIDDNSVSKPHPKMGMQSLDGSISPLERCSQRPGSIDGKERKPCTAGNVNGGVSADIHGKQGTCKTDGPIILKKELVATSSSCSDDLSKKEGSKKVTNQGQLKQASRNKEVHSAKKSNSQTDATAKSSTQTNKKLESNSSKDVKSSVWKGKMENHSTLGPSDFLAEEDDLPPSKRHCRAVETTKERVRKNGAAPRFESSSVGSVKPSLSVATKRRAVRLCDDEEEEAPKTPIHAGSANKLSCGRDTTEQNDAARGSSTAVQVMKKRVRVEDGSAKELSSAKRSVQDASPTSQKNVEKKLRETGGKNSSLSPKRLAPEKISVKDGKASISSPEVSPASVATSKLIPRTEKPSNGGNTKPADCDRKKKPPTSQGIESGVENSSHTSLQKQMSDRSKQNSTSERKKGTPKSSSHVADAVLVSGSVSGNGSVPGKRLEVVGVDKISSLNDLKISDPDTSMKDLIAAAQAKRRLAHLQNLNSNVFFATTPHAEAARSSPSSVSPVLPLGSSSIVRPDALGLGVQAHSVSPLSDVQRLSTPFQPETEQCAEKKTESGNCVTESSLSMGTEAAVARDAFEGMIETLSRTKESIGRATRLAIDCAKYGIATEVIELLIRKLQSENSMHRKVDLFFLVDSITQCSHNHKGIAGASYIPAVQAALSRLLGAVAPPAAAARENRRQCLKVLRLWLERKILPEAFLQPLMDDLGVSNDEKSSGLSLRRPSRVDRAFDDPIREMEGMLVDEYGSNATFQLAGFFSSHAFDHNDDDDDEDIMPINVYKEVSERSSGEHTSGNVDTENQALTPNERRHCILEDVDGELEMEDVSVPLKDGVVDVCISLKEETQYALATTEVAVADIYLETPSNNSELPPLPEGSPPLPPNSPPQTPPLPSSPPPVLPQLPPTFPLPPPSLPQANPLPLPLGGPSSVLLSQQPLQTEPSTTPQCLQPVPPSISSSPLVYQHQPSTNEISLSSSRNQLTHAATAHTFHVGLPGRNDAYGQFPCFVPLEAHNPQVPSLSNTSRFIEYSQRDAYGNTLSSQPSQQFQLPFHQTPLRPNAPPQNQPNHLAYSHPSAQTVYPHPQHSYPQSFSLPNLPDAPKLYVADETNNHYQSNSWMARGRSSSGAPFAHEGFPGPLPERPPPGTSSFQPPRPSTLPPGASVSGLVTPGQVDMRVHNWRPA